MKKLCQMAVCFVALASTFGCAAIQKRDLQVDTQTNGAVFLNPDILSRGKPIYVRVSEQASMKASGETLESVVIRKLHEKGYKTTKNAAESDYRLQATLLYLDKAKDGMTLDGAVAGGVGGAVIGAASDRGNLTSTAIGTAAGALVGSAVGAMFSVDKWYGVADIRVEEPLQKAAKRHVTSREGRVDLRRGGQEQTKAVSDSKGRMASWNASDEAQGSKEQSTMEYEETATHRKMATRVAVEASQANIDAKAAASEIREQLANSIAGIF